MRFSFREAPGWFTQYLMDNYMDEFHEVAKHVDWSGDSFALTTAAVEFFDQKGFTVWQYNRQLWFDIDETPEYTMLALRCPE